MSHKKIFDALPSFYILKGSVTNKSFFFRNHVQNTRFSDLRTEQLIFLRSHLALDSTEIRYISCSVHKRQFFWSEVKNGFVTGLFRNLNVLFWNRTFLFWSLTALCTILVFILFLWSTSKTPFSVKSNDFQFHYSTSSPSLFSPASGPPGMSDPAPGPPSGTSAPHHGLPGTSASTPGYTGSTGSHNGK